jgi:threonine dehydrogenase-like Zn-dependent dehydrogenase
MNPHQSICNKIVKSACAAAKVQATGGKVVEAPAGVLNSMMEITRPAGAIGIPGLYVYAPTKINVPYAHLLETTRVTVNAKRQNRRILGLEGAKRGFRFPHWQVGPNGKPFDALPDLFKRLGDDAWAVYRFLVQRHPELDGLTGREALQQGKTEQAIEAAESVARNPA